MISAQPSPIAHQGLTTFLSYDSSPLSFSPSTSASSFSSSDSPLSSPSISPCTLSPSDGSFGHALFRLVPAFSVTEIVLGGWTNATFKVINEFGRSPNESDPTTSLQLESSDSILPLHCSILQARDSSDYDGDDNYNYNYNYNDSNNNSENDNKVAAATAYIGVSDLLQIESQKLQATNWLGLASLSEPGIDESGQGGLEFRVTFKKGVTAAPGRTLTGATLVKATPTTTKTTNKNNVFWIRIGSTRRGIVPCLLGPFALPESIIRDGGWSQQRSSRPRSNPPEDEHSTHILRPFDIPAHSRSQHPHVLLLTERHNHMPQGRVWDSAFVLLEIFKNRVIEGIHYRTEAPVLAGKRILDLSTGTGLLGLYLAGLAEVELSASSSSSSSPSCSSPITQPTTVLMTDLADAMGLIDQNVEGNKWIAPRVDVSTRKLVWGESLSGKKDVEGLDLVIASDVIYEPKAFEPLLRTLDGLCAPGRTTIYLGYKRRSLPLEKETEFFEKIHGLFIVEETLHELGVRVLKLRR
ncbi:Methyltransferase-like protein 21A [Mortierella sp. AD031]|nr:Methyltransferase-like protein 21A [Mortierella sp. AD031]